MPSDTRRLILFDIDGTLISTGGRAGRALLRALVETYGVAARTHGYSFAGKTDPQILRELLTAQGLSPEAIVARRDEAFARYLNHLADELVPGSVQVLPGVREVLAALTATPGVTLGLLTGNIADGARLKLQAAGLAKLFPFGAYGSDAEDRNQLVPIARRRANQLTGWDFPGASTVVVGDAEADIQCARAGQARAVAVATGWTTREELTRLHPDALLDSLAASEALAALLNDGPSP